MAADDVRARLSAGGQAAMTDAYEGLLAVVAAVTDEQSWSPTGCLGWTVRDLVHHCVEDGRRALIAVHTESDRAPDTDAVGYWTAWGNDSDAALENRSATRSLASVYRNWPPLQELYAETAAAALRAVVALPPERVVATQGYAIRAGDLASTLAVETVLHHRDLMVALPAAAPPRPAAAAHARAVVDLATDQAAGGRLPASWPDGLVLDVATGRAAVPADAPAPVRALDLPVFS